MKRFLCLIFVALLLCQNVDARQAQTDTSDTTHPPSSFAVEGKNSADESPKPHQEQPDKKDSEVLGNQSTPLIQRVKQRATKPNLALLFSFLATGFAGLSWKVSKNAVTETKRASKAEFQPYIAFPESIRITMGAMTVGDGFKIRCIAHDIILKNTGKTSANNVTMSSRAILDYGDMGVFTVQNPITSIEGDFTAESPENLLIEFLTADVSNEKKLWGESNSVKKIGINITITFEDMFSKERRYIAKYIKTIGSIVALRQSVEETTKS